VESVSQSLASRTATPDLVNAGRHAAEALGEIANPRRIVIFGGDTDQKRSDSTILSWDSMDGQRW